MAKTFIFDLEAPLLASTEKLIAKFGVTKIDNQTIEMILEENETLDEAIIALNRLDVHVRNGRHVRS